jgi:acetolactate synthase-1/2/3 large subunit
VPSKTCARVFAECLVDHEVEYVFCLPGGWGSDLLWGEMIRVGIKPILVRDERSAVWMAEGYARTSKKPAVVCVGMQATGHAVNGLLDAYNMGVPIVVVTTSYHPASELDSYESHGPIRFQRNLYEACAKKVFEHNEPARIPQYVDTAFRVATTGVPGPVVLIQPDPIFVKEIDVERHQDPTTNTYPASRSVPAPDLIAQAATLLAGAERPVILTAAWGPHAQDFVSHYEATDELAALAELLAAPVAGNKGTLPDTHPLYAGYPGFVATGPLSRGAICNRLLAEADLVLMIGARPSQAITSGYKRPAVGARVIHIDFDPDAIGQRYPTELALVGDLQLTMRELVAALRDRPIASAVRRDAVYRELETFRAEWDQSVHAELTSSADPINPARVMHEINQIIDENTIVARAGGYCAGVYGTNYLHIQSSRQGWMGLSTGAAQIGTGIPMALGAKLGAPDRQVILIDGDGSFSYNLQEIETAARLGIDCVLIVLNNASLGYDRISSVDFHDTLGEGTFQQMFDYGDLDFAAVATALGAFGVRVTDPEQIGPALKEASDYDGPAVIDIVVRLDSEDETAKILNLRRRRPGDKPGEVQHLH